MKASIDTDLVHVLERLLVSCTDGIEGYRHAAGDVDDPGIRRFLSHSAAEREEIACVLTNTLVSLGYKPAHHGSLQGAVHRRWIDVIGILKPNPAHAILNECQRGEQETIAAFSASLRESLPEAVRSVVETQLSRVFQASSALNRVTCDLDDPLMSER